jgi:OOP family OmpA-OmpF porin
MRRPARALAALLAFPALAQEPAAPPPGALPVGALQVFAETRDPGDWPIPLRPAGGADPATETVEGRVTVRAFRHDGPVTTLGVARAVEAEFAADGWRTLLDCAGDACGGFAFRAALRTAPAPHMRVSLGDFRHLTLRRGDDLAALTVSSAGGAIHGQLVTVEGARRPATPETAGTLDLPEAPPAPPVDAAPEANRAPETAAPESAAPVAAAAPASGGVSAEAIGAALDAAGRAVLEGVAFRPNSTDLADNGASLSGAAAAIAARPNRAFVLVGHTDDSGPLDVNIRVGRQRAEAVRQALIALGAPAARLSSEGAGWLAPRVSNATEDGRALNRRVELLIR